MADRYQLSRYIGAGGMQDVWLATDLVFRRDVAIKTPKSNSARKRFKRSAVLSASINHPNVAKTLDFFEVGDREYLVEEFVPGGDLNDALLSIVRVVDPPLAARLMHNLAKGLAAAHEAEVVHRDIKPSNVLVDPSTAVFRAKFTDFGIAKMAEEVLADDVQGGRIAAGTSSSTFLGAMPYMAPEMLSDTRRSTKASDIWSLGAMGYEFISGVTPFGRGWDAIPKIRDGLRPNDPRPYYGPQFLPLIDEIWQIINACMQHDPTLRPTAVQLVSWCEALCYPIGARAKGTVGRRTYDWGFITPDEAVDDVFFHCAAVCGPEPKTGDRIMFGAFPGTPRWRVFPGTHIK